MKKNEFILGVDLDGVCADFYGAIRQIAAEWKGVPVESLTPEVTWGLPEWDLEPMGGYDSLHRFAVTQRKLFATLPPMPGVTSTLRRLSVNNVRIRIITHRLFIKYFHQQAVRQTIEWLDYHGIPYWDLCFMAEKGEVGADLYLEDSPSNIRKLRDGGHRVIIFDNSTNRDVEGERVESWAEVEKKIIRVIGEMGLPYPLPAKATE